MEDHEILKANGMKKVLQKISAIILSWLAIALLSGYGHTETHVPLNNCIALRFLELVNSGEISGKEKFRYYSFNWNNQEQPKLNGPAITGDYYLRYTEDDESDLSLTPVDWIANGGWMEDEPWGPASICHFYDPKGIDGGKKYLTDQSGKLEWAISIPKEWLSRDAKSWATGYENKYGWLKAKQYVVKALQEPNPEIRKNYMARAYRCLGQSLHLLADMGCPPHVRNDSHPPKVSFVVGDPDVYEDICKGLDTYSLFKANPPSPGLRSKFTGSESFAGIMEAMAGFTNENFFSGETIYTDRFNPVVRPGNPYPEPKMTETDYNISDFTYYRTVEGVKVKMCRDKTISGLLRLLGSDGVRGRPYLDKACVESMASVLMPDIAEAGANAIRLFIPSLNIEISGTSISNGGSVKGKVSYALPSQNDEYSGMFDMKDTYNGAVTLFVNGKGTGITVNARHNNFEFFLEGKNISLKQGDIVEAEIEFGGIVLKSPEFRVGGEAKVENVYIYIISDCPAVWKFSTDKDWLSGPRGSSVGIGLENGNAVQNGNIISVEWDCLRPGSSSDSDKGTATIILNDDNTVSIKLHNVAKSVNNAGAVSYKECSAEAEHIPFRNKVQEGLTQKQKIGESTVYNGESGKVLKKFEYTERRSDYEEHSTGFSPSGQDDVLIRLWRPEN
jgi:hypothetical protein